MTEEFGADTLSIVMRGLDPRIHAFPALSKTWMAGSSPAMTPVVVVPSRHSGRRHSASKTRVNALSAPIRNLAPWSTVALPGRERFRVRLLRRRPGMTLAAWFVLPAALDIGRGG
jgi:hypothetical protein